MPPAFSWFLAIRYLVTRWVNLVGLLGIALAVWALIVVIAVFSGFIGTTETGIQGTSPDLLITQLPLDADFGPISEALSPHTAALAPRLSHDAILFPIGGPTMAKRTNSISAGASSAGNNYLLLVGIDPEAENAVTGMRSWLTPVDPSKPTTRSSFGAHLGVEDPDAPFQLSPKRVRRAAGRSTTDGTEPPLIGPESGILLGARRLRNGDIILPGQRVEIISARFDLSDGTNARPELREIKINTYLSGAFSTAHQFFELGTCLIDIDVMRGAMGEDELSSRQRVSEIAVKLLPGADSSSVKDQITALLEPFGGGVVLDWREQNQTFISAISRERTLMKIVLFAVLVVAGFLIFATLHMMVVQKTKDIGILTSMGATPGGIGAVFVVSSIILGTTGCALGTIGGIASALSLNWICALFGLHLFPTDLYAIDETPINLEAGWILQVITGALILSILVAWVPARRAARLDPVRALMHE